MTEVKRMPENKKNPFKDSFKTTDKTGAALSVYNTGRQKCTPLYQWGPGVRDHYLLHYITSGRGCYEIDHRHYELGAGDLFVSFPSVPITYRADAQDPWEYCWAGFNGSDALTILSAAGLSRQSPVICHFARGEALAQRLHDLYESRGAGLVHTIEMTGRLYTALSLLLKDAPPVGAGSGELYVRQAVDYMHGHYMYPITVQDIAVYAGISRSQLYRSFIRYLGKSPKEYLTQLRLSQAFRLLRDTRLPITAIAISVGFDNSLYFSRVFQKACGISPGGWRSAQLPPQKRP